MVLRNWFAKPRWKTYSAQSGYVYQYVFEGVRDEREYVFRAVSGPQIEMTLQVDLEIAAWIQENRPLSDIERYGIAKMALLRALDSEVQPGVPVGAIRPSEAEVAAICRELDL